MAVSSGVCDGSLAHQPRSTGRWRASPSPPLKSLFPATRERLRRPGVRPRPPADVERPAEHRQVRLHREGGRDGSRAAIACTGEDRRNLYLHRDPDLLPGFPKRLAGDAEASPLLVDLDGDNRNELVLAGSRRPRARVAARRLRAARLARARRRAAPARRRAGVLQSGAVDAPPGGAFLASPAAADLNRDGVPEVLAADFEGKVYAWNADGSRRWKREANIDYSGKPLQPFVNVRQGQVNRTQHGFIGSPVRGRPRRRPTPGGRGRRAWIVTSTRGTATATTVPGFPMLVVDRSKVASIDPDTHAVKFKDGRRRRVQPGRDRRHARRRRHHRRRQAGDSRRDQRGVRGGPPTPATSPSRSSGRVADAAGLEGQQQPAVRAEVDRRAGRPGARQRRGVRLGLAVCGRPAAARAAPGRRRGDHRLARDRAGLDGLRRQRRRRAEGRRDPRRRPGLRPQQGRDVVRRLDVGQAQRDADREHRRHRPPGDPRRRPSGLRRLRRRHRRSWRPRRACSARSTWRRPSTRPAARTTWRRGTRPAATSAPTSPCA